MQKEVHRKWLLPVIIFFVFFAFLYIKILIVGVKVSIDMDLPNIEYAEFKIYWGEDGAYTELNSRQVKLKQGRHNYDLYLPVGFLGETTLRVDPIDREGQLTLHRVEIAQQAMHKIVFDSPEAWQRLEPVTQFDVLENTANGYKLLSNGEDPQMQTTVDFKFSGVIQMFRIIKELLFIAVLLIVFFRFLYPRIHQYTFVPVAALSVLVLVVTMAAISKSNGHPDEYVHFSAVDYYKNHLLPPDMTIDSIANTFSVYGVSRLSSFEMYYPLAGYAARIFDFFEIEGINAGRLFNVLLLLALVAFAWLQPKFRYFVLPILLSAQAWYLFSYANSDALGLFLCTFIGYQIAYEQSAFNRYLQQQTLNRGWLYAVVLALLFGGLLLIKLNYYFFALFVGLFILWRLFVGEFANKKLFWQRILCIGVLALIPFTVRFALDVSANGLKRDVLLEQLREVHADSPYKPSRPLEDTAVNLYFKDKGVTASEIYSRHRFFEQTFRSAFGVYGYMQFRAIEAFYDWVRYIGLALIALLFLAVLRSLLLRNFILAGIVLSVSVALAAISFYESWVLAFQPQGRYLMPLLPVFAVLFYRVRDYVWRPGVIGLSLSMFLLALYSFAWIGLGNY